MKAAIGLRKKRHIRRINKLFTYRSRDHQIPRQIRQTAQGISLPHSTRWRRTRRNARTAREAIQGRTEAKHHQASCKHKHQKRKLSQGRINAPRRLWANIDAGCTNGSFCRNTNRQACHGRLRDWIRWRSTRPRRRQSSKDRQSNVNLTPTARRTLRAPDKSTTAATTTGRTWD